MFDPATFDELKEWRQAEARAIANARRDFIWQTNKSVADRMRFYNRPARVEGEDAADFDDPDPTGATILAEPVNLYGIDAPALPIHAALDAVHAARKRLRLPINWPETV